MKKRALEPEMSSCKYKLVHAGYSLVDVNASHVPAHFLQ